MEGLIDITPIEELIESLPLGQKVGKVVEDLCIAYAKELCSMINNSRCAFRPHFIFGSFCKNDDQFIAEFSVEDLTLPKSEWRNFPGRDNSRSVYSGCILVKAGQVSTQQITIARKKRY